MEKEETAVQQDRSRHRRNKAIACLIFSAFSFSLMNLCVKASGDLPAIQKSFFRNLVAAFVALVMLIRSGEGFSFQKRNLPLLILRSTQGTIGIFGNFYAVGKLVLSDASMLNKLSPFFTLLFSFIFLREKLKPFHIISIAGAFIGSMLIIKPGFDFTAVFPALCGAVGGMAAGGAYTCVRGLGLRGERGTFIVFFFSTFSCLAALPYLLLNYHPMTLMQLFFLLLAGVGATGGQFGITAAYQHAPAREISIYDYTQILFAAAWSFIFFDELPDRLSVIGYVIIFAMSAVMFFYNRKEEEAA